MIICPTCKEEIDDDSHFCDQCGQALLYCNHCGRVGIGRRCTSCGGMMVTPNDLTIHKNAQASFSYSTHTTGASINYPSDITSPRPSHDVPGLSLVNDTLNIRIMGIDGAVIGRRTGPYVQHFEQNRYVSGVHAQLKYKADSGWCVIDKHSSNGTKLNEHLLQPDVEMTLKNGDILTIANINLQVSVN